MLVTTTSRPLRDYQEGCIRAALSAIQPAGSYYYVLPTGTGKTRIATALVEHLTTRGRILVFAHRKELIEQMAAAIRDDVPSSEVGIVMAKRKEISARVCVGTFQTLSPKIVEAWLDQGTPYAILIDEAHHCIPGSQYDRIIKQIRARYPDVIVIGCTATPYRNDNSRMQEVLTECVFERDIPTMQHAGWLCGVSWKSIQIPLNLSELKTSMSGGERDYDKDQLAELVSPHTEHIVSLVKPHLSDRPALAFCCNVEHAHEVARAFNAAGIRAATVWGDMPREERERTLDLWKRGIIQIVCNYGVLTEGFDYTPRGNNKHGLGVVLITRVTMSPSLYLQMLGRGTRLKPADSEYQDCLVFDLCGNANLLETKQVMLPRVLPAFDEEFELDSKGFVRVGYKDEEDSELGPLPPKEKKPRKPPRLRVNDPLTASWVSWGYHAQSGTYYAQLKPGLYAVMIKRETGLYSGYVIEEITERDELRKKDYGTGRIRRRQPLTDKPKPLTEMMLHCNHVISQHGLKKLASKEAPWQQKTASPQAISMLSRKDPVLAQEARVNQWKAIDVSLAIAYRVIRPELIKIWKEWQQDGTKTA